jgi:hypothetical protein
MTLKITKQTLRNNYINDALLQHGLKIGFIFVVAVDGHVRQDVEGVSQHIALILIVDSLDQSAGHAHKSGLDQFGGVLNYEAGVLNCPQNLLQRFQLQILLFNVVLENFGEHLHRSDFSQQLKVIAAYLQFYSARS